MVPKIQVTTDTFHATPPQPPPPKKINFKIPASTQSYQSYQNFVTVQLSKSKTKKKITVQPTRLTPFVSLVFKQATSRRLRFLRFATLHLAFTREVPQPGNLQSRKFYFPSPLATLTPSPSLSSVFKWLRDPAFKKLKEIFDFKKHFVLSPIKHNNVLYIKKCYMFRPCLFFLLFYSMEQSPS